MAELRWAADAGLRGRELPGAPPLAPPLQRPGLGAVLGRGRGAVACRSAPTPGAGDPAVFQGPELTALMSIESGGWFSRRSAHLLIFAGVFERHPELKLVLTEQPGEWWPAMADELDSVHRANTGWGGPLKKQVPLAPSEYLHRNVWIGASFLSRAEAQGAVARRLRRPGDVGLRLPAHGGHLAARPHRLQPALAAVRPRRARRGHRAGDGRRHRGPRLRPRPRRPAGHRRPHRGTRPTPSSPSRSTRCPSAPAPSPSAPTAPGTDRARPASAGRRIPASGAVGAGAMVSGPAAWPSG